MTNVYKIELAIIDHDDIGAEAIKEVLENTRYPNRCISPKVLTVEGKDIGEWYDEHPLNYTTTQKQELARLFSPWLPITTAPRDGTRIIFFYGERQAIFTAWYDMDYSYSYFGVQDGIVGDIPVYKYWHLITPKDEEPACFEEENPANCYWQPLMELPHEIQNW
jgi:hypothetical protein